MFASPNLRIPQPPPPLPLLPARVPRTLHLALFAIGLLWLLAARIGAENAAQGIAHLVHNDLLRPPLNQIFALVLLLTGFTALNWVASRNGSLRETNALPARRSANREWQKGVALGWGLLLITVLPMALTGDLHPQFWFAPRAWLILLLSTFTVLVGSLVTELAFRGFLFKHLMAAIGPASAMVILSALYAFSATSLVNTTPYSFFVSVLIGILFSLAYLRTHALWFGWGLRFGWLASMGLVFGLPVSGSVDLVSVVATDSSGKLWLTGGAYGPQGALFTGFVLLAGMFALYQLTRNYAWDYTHPPIVPAGYPMSVPPPAAHTAMETAAAPPPLVQILGTNVPTTNLPGTTTQGTSSPGTVRGPMLPGGVPDQGSGFERSSTGEPGEGFDSFSAPTE